jgi:DNA-binding NarL/FixJ family response regulator
MNVVIVEDHSVLLYGLIEIVESKFELDSIEGFCTPTKAESHVNWQDVDLLIVDLEFKNGDCGINFANCLRKAYSKLRIIAYSSHKIFSVLNQLKRNGFNSYVCKEMPIKELINTIDVVIKQSVNGFYESDSYRKFMHDRKTVENKFFTSLYEKQVSLTPTENKVCQLIAINPKLDNTILAKQMEMKLNTLKKHITSIYKKLDVKSKEGICMLIKCSALTKDY